MCQPKRIATGSLEWVGTDVGNKRSEWVKEPLSGSGGSVSKKKEPEVRTP